MNFQQVTAQSIQINLLWDQKLQKEPKFNTEEDRILYIQCYQQCLKILTIMV